LKKYIAEDIDNTRDKLMREMSQVGQDSDELGIPFITIRLLWMNTLKLDLLAAKLSDYCDLDSLNAALAQI